MSIYLIYLFIFVLGICCGSFLNCVIYRLEKKKSFSKGRSLCPKCKHILKWYDLFPILSFLMLRGRCRYCRRKISWRYPIVEIATGLLFVLICWRLTFGIVPVSGVWTFRFFYLAAVSSLLVVVFVYDLKHYIIPDKVIYPAIGLAFLYRLLALLREFPPVLLNDFVGSILSGLAVAAFFFLLWFGSQGRWLGFGDVKLAFLMGIFLGFPDILVALFLAFFIGAIIGLGLIVLGKKTLKSPVPFGPFLITGVFIALFWGKELIRWYLGFL